jgi:hypothetical protein
MQACLLLILSGIFLWPDLIDAGLWQSAEEATFLSVIRLKSQGSEYKLTEKGVRACGLIGEASGLSQKSFART